MKPKSPAALRSPATAPGDDARYASARQAKLHELESRLQLVAAEGRIWLDGQRMVMMHGDSLWLLREELISSLGQETARGLLTRIGYASGCRDAAIALNRSEGLSLSELIITGGLLHAIQGRANCCASCRPASSSVWAAPRPCAPTSGSWRPPTKISKSPCDRAAFAKTCITGSRFFPSASRRCASAATTSPC